MTDEVNAAPEQDTPPVDAAPVEDTQPKPVVDYEGRYNNLRSEFDRKSQRLAELEAEREQWQEAQEQYQEEEGDEYDEYDDPYLKKLEQIEARQLAWDQRFQERDEQETLRAQQQEQVDYVNNEIEVLEKELEEEFTDDEWETLGHLSERFTTEDGKPDVRRAYERLFAREGSILAGRRAKWTKTKRSPKPGSGAAAVKSVDKSTRKGRIEALDQKFDEADM